MEHDDLYELIPAYALGALDPDERARFETWLRANPDAHAVLEEYRQVAAHLVALAPVQPAPERLQADLRRRIAAERPAAGDVVPPGAPEPGSPPAPVQVIRPRRRWRVAAILAAAAILLVVVGVLLIQARGPEPELELARTYERLSAAEGASRYAIVPGEVDDAVTGDLVVAPDEGEAVIRVAELPPLAEDQIFQLWLIDREGNRISGGLFREQTREATYVRVPLEQPLDAYQAFGVSLEPEAGSPFPDQPSGPRVFSIPLSS